MKNDEQLIAEIRTGNLDAFDVLYARYAPGLLAYIKRFAGDDEVARDLFHDTFMQVISHLNLDFERAKFAAWLYKVARNLSLNYLRNNRRIVNGAAPEPAAVDNPEQTLVNRQLAAHFLERLSDEHREVFLLKRQGGFSYEEISRIVEVPIGTVRSRLHYCVKELHIMTKEYQHEL